MKPPTFSYRIARRRSRRLPKASPLRFYFWTIVDDRTGAVVARDARDAGGGGWLDVEDAEREAVAAAEGLGLVGVRRSYPIPFSAATVFGEG